MRYFHKNKVFPVDHYFFYYERDSKPHHILIIVHGKAEWRFVGGQTMVGGLATTLSISKVGDFEAPNFQSITKFDASEKS